MKLPNRELLKRVPGWRARVLLALAPALAALGCGKPGPEEQIHDPAKVTDPLVLFDTHCSGCHGAGGRFGPAPPLDDALLIRIMSAQEMKEVVIHGRAGTPMPAWALDQGGPLSEEQIDIVVRSIRERQPGASAILGPLPPYAIGVSATNPAKEDLERGRTLFADICATCHGQEGMGKDAGPLNDASFLALISPQLLRRIIITGRQDLGMPDYEKLGQIPDPPRPLSSRDIDDIVAYVLSWRDTTPWAAPARSSRGNDHDR